MENRHGHPDFYKYTEEMNLTHDDKNREYAQGGDPLGNFKRVSAILKVWGWDIPPWLVAVIYELKQTDCAMWMLAQGYQGELETIDERLEDKGVYSVLERILVKEEQDG